MPIQLPRGFQCPKEFQRLLEEVVIGPHGFDFDSLCIAGAVIMASRPPAPTSIVSPNEILTPAATAAERWQLGSLYHALVTTELCLQWVARRRLIHNVVVCPICNAPASLVKRDECRHCHFTEAVRADSVFQRSHFPFAEIVLLTYCWATDMLQNIICRETDIPLGHVVTDCCNFMREEAEIYVEQHSQEIRSFNENGESITVKIDKSKFFHRKYHRGIRRQDHWFLEELKGGQENASLLTFQIELLLRCRLKFVNTLGSHIVSEWAVS